MRNKIFQVAAMIMLAIFSACGGDDGLTADNNSGNNNNSSTTVDADTISDSYVYKLPVVFHVLYSDRDDSLQYIPAEHLRKLLTYVNELYEGDVYYGNIKGQNIGVQFVPATEDESGSTMATPGVVYHRVGGYPISLYALMGDITQRYNRYIWDPNNYINVLVYNFKSEDEDSDEVTLGMSRSPYALASGDSILAGLDTVSVDYISKDDLPYAYCISLNSLYAYEYPTRYTQADHGRENGWYLSDTGADIVGTLAHELGHYLGLFHVFSEVYTDSGSEIADSCADTDYCDDTHSYNYHDYLNYVYDVIEDYYYSDSLMTKLLTRYSCDGVKYLSDNLMDYDYSYYDAFSPEQKARMRWVLYYSPLIPGPKKNHANERTARSRVSTSGKPLDLPVKYYK